MRSVIHHHNERLNQLAQEKLRKVSDGDITFDALGRAISGIYVLIFQLISIDFILGHLSKVSLQVTLITVSH